MPLMPTCGLECVNKSVLCLLTADGLASRKTKPTTPTAVMIAMIASPPSPTAPKSEAGWEGCRLAGWEGGGEGTAGHGGEMTTTTTG